MTQDPGLRNARALGCLASQFSFPRAVYGHARSLKNIYSTHANKNAIYDHRKSTITEVIKYDQPEYPDMSAQ